MKTYLEDNRMRIKTALEVVEETRKWVKTAWGVDIPLEPIITEIKALEQQPFINKPCVSEGVCQEDKIQVLDNIKVEIKAKIEEEEFARSVFRHEEKDDVKAEQCTGSIMAYKNVIKIIDKYMAESEE